MLGIIAGTGFTELSGVIVQRTAAVSTVWGESSAAIQMGHFNGHPQVACAFLARHGNPHTIPPHRVNYRANMAALQEVGCTQIVAVNAVGGIAADTAPAMVIIPHDVIDYTHGRVSSYWDDAESALQHVDMCEPYSADLRERLIAAAEDAAIVPNGVMAVTQGPRLETPAEIRRLEQDGCTIVGMTGMPEAALAKELSLPFASIAFSVNWAAGKQPAGQNIHAEIEASIHQGTQAVLQILQRFVAAV